MFQNKAMSGSTTITRETIIHHPTKRVNYAMRVSRKGEKMKLSFSWEKLHRNVKTPFKKNFAKAGWTCCSNRNIAICSGESRVVSLGFKITQYPKGMYGRFASRTTLAIHHGIEVGNQILDPDYFDEVRVIIHNFHNFKTFEIKRGDPICILTFEPFCDLATFGTATQTPLLPGEKEERVHCYDCGSSSPDEDHSDGEEKPDFEVIKVFCFLKRNTLY